MKKFESNPQVRKQELLEWASVPRSSFYYKRGPGKPGRKPSNITVTREGELVDNSVIVKEAETILQQEFCCYGYKNVWDELKEQGYIINHKKVYRLMKSHNLLFNRRIGSIGVPRQFVRFRKIRAEKPLEHLCMDIKYVHIHGARRNALLLTVIDVFSRKALTHMLRFNIKKGDVIVLLSLLLMEYKIEYVTIRNDNGSQFIAHVVREFLKSKGVNQEFTHVATPEENAYIEALHSNIQREVIKRYEFESIYHAQMIFNRYYEWYNNNRKHGSLGRKSPENFLCEYALISGPYKTEKSTDIVSNLNPNMSRN
jgi:transposase InsO family protein